ncbi:hypothetical protein [Celeribacter halophilus]|jgi:hypothetical protein|uniref:hypothetical protein n=1 Tax=Celeribacter halophilus TaxID=576117 RepID=UPI002FD16765
MMDNEIPDELILTCDILDGPALSLEERAERIADVLENGQPSETFLQVLAEMIRPKCKRYPYTLTLHHSKAGAPSGPDYRLGYEMVELVDEKGESPDVAVALIQERYGKKGYSRSKCLSAMKAARKDIRLSEWFLSVMDKDSPK